MRFAWVIGGLGMACVLGCGGNVSPAPSSVMSTTAFQAAETKAHGDVMTAYKEEHLYKGVIVEVTCPFGTWIDAQGVADDAGTPMTPNLSFRAASVTKLFTAMVLLQVLEEQGISPSDHIANYIPNPNSHTASIWPKITIEELANHTSGLASPSLALNYGTIPDYNNAPPGGWTSAAIIPWAVNVGEPGENYVYANVNFTILAELAENLTHASLGQNIQTRFIQPLGLTNTTLTSSGTTPALACHGFQEGVDVTQWDPSWSYGAGNLVSSVGDLTTWVRAMFNGNLISPAAKSILMQTNSVSTNTGFGAQQYSTWWGHTGRIYGYACAAFYNPTLDATIVVIVNNCDGDGSSHPQVPVFDAIVNDFFPGYPFKGSATQP